MLSRTVATRAIGATFALGLITTTGIGASSAPAQTSAAAGGAAAPDARDTGAVAPTSTRRPKAALRVGAKRIDIRAGRTARVTGRLRAAGERLPRRVVVLERRGRGGWSTLTRTRTSSSGRFVLRHRTAASGSSLVRVRFAGDRAARTDRDFVGRLNAYRSAFASWYGPGLYGNNLGCGGRLYSGTVGVAHKSLPCGTPITLRRGSRTVRTRVIDRGPYVGGREFDLTAETKRRLGFGSTGTILVAH